MMAEYMPLEDVEGAGAPARRPPRLSEGSSLSEEATGGIPLQKL